MLTQEQIEQFDRDGFLIFPDLFSPDEVEATRSEIRRLQEESRDVVREKSGDAVRMFYRLHDERSATPSELFQRMARMPRLLRPAQQVLRENDLYIFHSKCNVKEAIDGATWQWHQDYAIWQYDGVPTPNLVTFMVMADDATEIGGCLYVIPGSHKLGVQEPDLDHETDSYKLQVVPKKRLIEIMETSPRPVPVVGKAGTGMIFHSNLIHGSGHNMWKDPRWHLYFVYNPVANKTRDVENPRPEHVRSLDFRPLAASSDTLPTPAA